MTNLSKDSDGDDEDRPVEGAAGGLADSAAESASADESPDLDGGSDLDSAQADNLDELEAEFADIDAAAALDPVGVGAGANRAGSARAAARASGARTGVTPGKGHATRSRGQGVEKGSIFQRLRRFLREVVSELRKVIWPTKNEMVTYSIVVVLFLIFMIALTWGADLGFSKLIFSIFG